MSAYQRPYQEWLERMASANLLVFSALIVTLLPAFHFVLGGLPGVPPDSLTLRLAAAGVSLCVAAGVLCFPALRRHATKLQLLNCLPTVLVIPILVVNSGNNPLYVASSLLACLAVQQAFFRFRDVIIASIAAVACQAAYSAARGIFWEPSNLATLGIVTAGYVIAVAIGILRIRLAKSQLSSRYDTLTKLPNRESLFEHLRGVLRSAKGTEGCAVLFLDLDRFKDINDTLGHGIGDTLLHAVGARFASVVPPNALLARWGGDEFVLVVASNDLRTAARELAEDLLRATYDPFTIEGNNLFVTASVGIAIYPENGEDAIALIRSADAAMYRAKESGDVRIAFFEREMHSAALLRQRIRNELRRALEEESFELHYQPIYDVANAVVVGAEALVRWREADGSLIMPLDFIPIAEQSGLIGGVGIWVLGQACRQLRAWCDAGAEIGLSINVSPYQLAHHGFLDALSVLVKRWNIAPGLLSLEITESVLMSYSDEMLALLREIRALGVKIAIDDFGTGYSSFAYLKRLPVDSLKIDRAFVKEIEHATDRTIVESVVTIARVLGLTVTAEGVETKEQLGVLAQAGCNHVQGYFIGKPMPADVFEHYFVATKAPAPASEGELDPA